MTRPGSSPASTNLHAPAADPDLWNLDPATVFLNHGSFGSCPRAVLAFQRALQDHLERQPVHFFVRELEPLWDRARAALAAFVGSDADDLVFVPNATSGVNTVLRSLRFEPGDELLVTDHEYNACQNALHYIAERSGAKVVLAHVPFPVPGPEEVLEAVLREVSSRTRIVLLDHVTSQTGIVLPIADIARALAHRGVELLVDGAHAPGMVPLNLRDLGATYYTGNCHKWICAPKGAAFLYVRGDRQPLIRPLVISHGANSPRVDRTRFLIEFGWMGTGDPTAALSVSEALGFVNSLLPGGWPEVMEHNRNLALAARQRLCRALQIDPPAPDEMIGALASMPLPDGTSDSAPQSPLYADLLQDQLRQRFNIEVPVIPWPRPPKRVLRISAQLYNSVPQYERLAEGLNELLVSRA